MSEYRNIDLSAWIKVGEGGNGVTYENPSQSDIILKVNKPRLSCLDTVKHEYEVSQAVERLGLSTPKMYEMVRVGDAYATIAQRIKHKKSLSRICHDEPERLDEMAALLAQQGKQLFATPCDTTFFPSRREQMLQAIDKATFVSREHRQLLRRFAESIPENDHCVHGDFQSGNLIMAEGVCYWIDLDRFAHGDPMFDIGHLFQICKVYSSMKQVQDIFHMTQEQLLRFWDAFAKAYTGEEDHAAFDHLAGKFACLDVIVRTIFVSPSFAEKLFFGHFVRRLVKQYYLK